MKNSYYEYEYAGEAVRYFRLDVMKADLVATVFEKGSSDWKFFSVPIIPQVADPFVNLGDDIDPLQVFWYDSKLDGYKVYPLDLGAVSLITGRGYFTRLASDSSSDVSTILGTRDNANTGRDGLDQSEPPTLGQTVAAYFDHQDWGDESGLYNTDYQPTLKVGEERIWEFTVFTDKPKADMKLSWDSPISRVPGDIMLYIRRCETTGSGKAKVITDPGNQNMDLEWHNMREVSSVNVKSDSLITRVIFEVRAQRFPAAPPSEMQINAGEKEIALCWKADTNEFITGYTIARQNGCASDWREGEGARDILQQTPDNPVSRFADIHVMEEMDYTYQVSVRFRSGLELRSELLSVRSLPVIKLTALMQSYPNPFNPEVWIPYELSEQAVVSIQIYNSSGQLIRTLDLGAQTRGRYTSKAKAAYWDGCNQTGELAASGVYFYVLRAGDFTEARKMVLLR